MATTHKNRVQMTVTGTPGTGTITLNAAVSTYQTFGAAHGANATVDVLITDGTAWEVARDCAYTHSGTTLGRGTLEASSTGSAISLTSAAVVSQILTADRGRQLMAAALDHSTVTGTSGAISAEVNTLYIADMSGWTADRTLTLPAVAAVGDRVGMMEKVGDADYEWLITAASGDTLNGVAGGTEWSRLFITGEVVILRCVAANATWVVEYDGRIPCVATWQATGSGTNTQSISASTWTKVLDDTFSAELFDVGSVMGSDGTNIAATIRRAGKYELLAGIAVISVADQKEATIGIFLNAEGTPSYRLARLPTSGPNSIYPKGSISVAAAAGDAYTIAIYHTDSVSRSINDYVGYNVFSLKELL